MLCVQKNLLFICVFILQFTNIQLFIYYIQFHQTTELYHCILHSLFQKSHTFSEIQRDHAIN